MKRLTPHPLFLCLIAASIAAVPPAKRALAQDAAEVKIDAARTGPPVSKYIYGQFIEHLGRCIYGGIWAEMLEDRKFYHAVGGRESPWRILGGPDAASMSRRDPYVGDHTPELKPGGGIAQAGLALRKGKAYVGRIVLAGAGASAEVHLVWGAAPGDRKSIAIDNLGDAFAKTPLNFTADADTDDGRLEIVARGGTVRVGTVSLMPADNVHGMRADTLALLKELNAPIYRWPGGNFVSGYEWRDGLGDMDRRPPRKNPAWRGEDTNDFGLHEFLLFCETLGTEPYIAVNSGFGDAYCAAQEVQYVNGGPETPMGKWRAENGHPQPWGVKWWGIGNEMYGRWQLGHMALDQYVRKHNLFAEAMRKADPSIVLIGVGDAGPWSEGMLAHCAGHMDHLSEHFYCQEKKDLVAHVAQIRDRVRQKAEAHRAYRARIPTLKGKDIRIALDEWNYWYGEYAYGELGTRYFLKDALGAAAGIHELARNSDLFVMANYAQTVNVIGCIKTTKTAAAFETTGLVLKLYRAQFGEIPLAVSDVPAPLDICAALTGDRQALTVAVVNPTNQPRTLALNVAGARPGGEGCVWTIAGTDPMAYNTPGKPPAVEIRQTAIKDAEAALNVPPLSVSLYRLPLAK